MKKKNTLKMVQL